MGGLGVVYSRMVVAGLDLSDRMHRIRPELQAAIVGGVFGLLAFFAPGQ
jgi:H+/Cl- antiporter ClcA